MCLFAYQIFVYILSETLFWVFFDHVLKINDLFIELQKFLIYNAYTGTEAIIRYITWKYFLLTCGLFFHFFDGIFLKHKIFNFEDVQIFIYFFFLDYAFGVQLKTLPSPKVLRTFYVLPEVLQLWLLTTGLWSCCTHFCTLCEVRSKRVSSQCSPFQHHRAAASHWL